MRILASLAFLNGVLVILLVFFRESLPGSYLVYMNDSISSRVFCMSDWSYKGKCV